MAAFKAAVQDNTLILEFKTLKLMSLYMDDISSFYEGKLSSTRIGHNFPMCILNAYGMQVQKKQYIDEIVEQATCCCKKDDIVYVIAYVSGDVHTKQHELRHAMYYSNAEYKAKILKAWNDMDDKTRDKIEAFLVKLGYPENVIVDEFQAYYFTEKKNFFGVKVGHLSF